MSLPGRRLDAPLRLSILLLSIFHLDFWGDTSNFTGAACWALGGEKWRGGVADLLSTARGSGARGRRGRSAGKRPRPPGAAGAARPERARAPGRRSCGAGGARRLCGGGGRDGRRGECCCRAGSDGRTDGRREGRKGEREALARLPAPRSAGCAALPGQQSHRQSKWGGGAERATLRGSRQPRAAARRASNAPHFSACAALPPSPPAPGAEAFVFPGRCDGRKLPGGMGSGRACAAPGSAGLRPHREVRRGGRGGSAGPAAAPPGRGAAGRAAGAGTELRWEPRGAPTAVLLPPAAVPPPERRSSPGEPCPWTRTARGSAPRGGCVGTGSRAPLVPAGSWGGSAAGAEWARSAASRGPWSRLRGLPPPPAAGGGRASGRRSSRELAWLPPAPRHRLPGHRLEARGSCLLAVTCSSGCCLCSTLEPARVGTASAYRSWRKEIETSRLVFICFRLLKRVCYFYLRVPHGFPNLFYKSQMRPCSLVCIYIYVYN